MDCQHKQSQLRFPGHDQKAGNTTPPNQRPKLARPKSAKGNGCRFSLPQVIVLIAVIAPRYCVDLNRRANLVVKSRSREETVREQVGF